MPCQPPLTISSEGSRRRTVLSVVTLCLAWWFRKTKCLKWLLSYGQLKSSYINKLVQTARVTVPYLENKSATLSKKCQINITSKRYSLQYRIFRLFHLTWTVDIFNTWITRPTRCHFLVLCWFLLYSLLNMFRATLCPSSGADDLEVFIRCVAAVAV